MLSVGQQSLLGYLPALIIKNILDGKINFQGKFPQFYTMQTVSLFADISGFTKLSEAFSKKGRIGPEFLAFSLNRYMEQLSKNGGDIFKFAGDAILVIWPENDDLTLSCRRAMQCALDIQSKLNDQEITPNKRLSVKIGIGVGECRILVVGGQFRRCEYLSVGEALRQACESETKATKGGETICSEDVRRYVIDYFEMEEVKQLEDNDHGHGTSTGDMKYYIISKSKGERTKIKADAFLMRTRFNSDRLRESFPILKTFVPAAITLYLDIEKESWSKEIRMLTIMFLNLKVDLSQTKTSEGMDRIQSIVRTVQRSIYRTRGALNKFLMDDKGSVMLICWGLPPMSSPDDPVRSVLSALTLVEELKKIKCGAYMGITTGTCFAGVCGTIGNRREYSLLGEVVNLSARYMGQAMKYSGYNKLEHLVLIDEKTRNLVQNKIRCEYLCSGELKGFVGNYNFFTPAEEINFSPNIIDPFPFIRTHRNNTNPTKLPPDDKTDLNVYLTKSQFMMGQHKNTKLCVKFLNDIYLKSKKQLIFIRGSVGSGKSLFIRKALTDFLSSHKELKSLVLETVSKKQLSEPADLKEVKSLKPPFMFFSFQNPITYHSPLNGFNLIFKEIYLILKHLSPKVGKPQSSSKNYKYDAIGEILINKKLLRYVKYIEEIISSDLSVHYQRESLDENEVTLEPPPRHDVFFDLRKYEDFRCEQGVCVFFKSLLKLYIKFLHEFYDWTEHRLPLIIVAEDSHSFDEISINFIKMIREAETKGGLSSLCLIVSHQIPLYPVMANPSDKMAKFFSENVFSQLEEESIIMMEPILDKNELQDFLKFYLADKILDLYKTSIDRIDPVILNILMAKSFNGNPLFILDMVDSLINSKKFVQILSGELIVTSELTDMEEMRDWSNFTIPMRMEKIIGNIIDSLSAREIIVLKYASVIGNLFDVDKLEKCNPFNNLASDELTFMMINLEQKGVIEILYDLNPKEMVCKFGIPFLREILYQRMLIEQKNDLHLFMARSLQNTRFKYMPHSQENKFLELHLKTTEKTLTSQMEDESENEHLKLIQDQKKSELNLNNLKIFLVKDICERLKNIDMKIDGEEELNHNYHFLDQTANSFTNNQIERKTPLIQAIKSGLIEKKSDKNYTWEARFIVLTNTKFFYFYHEKEYLENKLPLATILLKNLFDVEILNDYQFGSKSNLFSFQVSSWNKKTSVKGQRKFFFCVRSREELLQWVVTLNFLRVKATYDEFSNQFGLIHLPLKHEVRKAKKKFKVKFKGRSQVDYKDLNQSHSAHYFNSIARKSLMASSKHSQRDIINKSSLAGRNSSIGYNNLFNYNTKEHETKDKLEKSKKTMASLFNAFVIVLANMQDAVFNDCLKSDKIIPLPEHVKHCFPELDEDEDEESERHSSIGQIDNNSQAGNIQDKKDIQYQNSVKFSLDNRIETVEKVDKAEQAEKEPKVDKSGAQGKSEINKVPLAESNSDDEPIGINNKNMFSPIYGKAIIEESYRDYLDDDEEDDDYPSNNNVFMNNNFANLAKKQSTTAEHAKPERKSKHNLPIDNHNVFTLDNESDTYSHATNRLGDNLNNKSIKQDFVTLETFANRVPGDEINSAANALKADLISDTFNESQAKDKLLRSEKRNKVKFNYKKAVISLLDTSDKASLHEENDYNLSLINKMKNLELSVDESENELFNLMSKFDQNFEESKKLSSNLIILNETNLDNNESNNISQDNKKNNDSQESPRYTNPKYDFLKKDKSHEIYKTVHSSKILKQILKK